MCKNVMLLPLQLAVEGYCLQCKSLIMEIKQFQWKILYFAGDGDWKGLYRIAN